MKVNEWGLLVGEMHKAFESRIRGLAKLYLNDVHIMWLILKSNALTEVMKALMRDFPGSWDYGKVVKKLRRSHAEKNLSFGRMP